MRQWSAWAAAILSIAVLSALGGCITAREASYPGYGAAPMHVGFVPARIAILPCQAWPSGARFQALPLTNVPADVLTSLCNALDAYVLDGFGGQPFMKGYSSGFVARNLTSAGQSTHLAQLPEVWRYEPGACLDCPSAPAFYGASIQAREPWHLWLQTLSQSIRNADAVLMPFVTYAYERRYEDRGLLIGERAAGMSLLLVETGTGALLWAGGREASVPAKQLDKPGATPPELPPWSTVNERLLTDTLWWEFPGRQTFN